MSSEASAELRVGLCKRSLRDQHGGDGGEIFGLRIVIFTFRHRFLREKLLGALPVAFRQLQFGPGLLDARLRAQDRGFGLLFGRLRRTDLRIVGRVVDIGQHRARLDPRAVVDALAVGIGAEGDDLAGHLRADVDQFLRFDGAGGADGAGDIGADDRLGIVADGGLAAGISLIPPVSAAGQRPQNDQYQKYTQHLFHL